MNGLASILALLAALLVTPWLDEWSHRWVTGIFVSTYGADFAGLIRWGWAILLGAMVFFTARAFIAIALMLIGSWAIMRFGAFI